MPTRLLERDQGQNLHGLAQPHVISQYAAQSAFAEQIEPGYALRLIGSEPGAKALRQARIAQALGMKQSGETTKIVRALEDEPVTLESEERHDVGT